MGSYEIGISGINAAQKALDIIGNNIANAATPGYHKQEIDLRPRRADSPVGSGLLIGQGVDFAGINRLVNSLLDGEIIRQESTLSQISKELDTLRVVESSFGELSTSGLSSVLDNFFNSLRDLSASPADVNLQGMVISNAQLLANRFRSLDSMVTGLQEQVYAEAQDTVDKINLLAEQIAGLNGQIHSKSVKGQDANNLLDRRDTLISDLSQLVGVKTIQREYGVVDVIIGETTIVPGSQITGIQLGLTADGDNYNLAVAPEGSQAYTTDITGGSLGGLFSLGNGTLRDIHERLDTLVGQIVTQINKIHVQGVGSSGSFTSLVGWSVGDTQLGQLVPPVTAGTIYVRVTAPDGTATRHSIDINPQDKAADVAAAFAAFTGLGQTCINGGKLQIKADSGYKFDFLSGVLSSPDSYSPNPLTGAGAGADQMPPKINISGIYTGSENQTYTFTVKTATAGEVLSIGSGDMQLEVKNSQGVTVATINAGAGYVPGSLVEVESGVKISFAANGTSAGYFNDGDVFTVSALAESDTGGFLAAAGINCFFSGTDAGSIALSGDILASGGRIAVSGSVEMTDNAIIAMLSKTGDEKLNDFAGLTPRDYYRKLITDTGTKITVLQTNEENTQGVWQSLKKQRDEISGVDMNDEAARMLVFERMFQAMAKYMNTVSKALETVMEMI